jgi:hypothetical protein
MKTLQILIKEYYFDHQDNYFEMIMNSWFNGQYRQAKEQFNEMDNNGKREFFSFIAFASLLPKDIQNLNLFFINEILN